MEIKLMKYCLYALVLVLVTTDCKKENAFLPGLVRGYTVSDSRQSPGYALQVIKGDSIVLEQYEGIEGLASREPISEKSLFNIGSISKTFVAYAILHLAHEGRIHLNDSLLKYFPDFKNPEIGKKIRLYHLLTHTSGLPDNRPVQTDSLFYLTADDEQNWAPLLQNDSLHFEPGTRYEYSNPAFNALALIIQQVTGFKWQDYIKLKIFTAARMSGSTITDGLHPDEGVCHAYLPLPGGQWKEQDYGEEPTFNASGNGGVWSSVYELALYEKAIRFKAFFEPEALHLAREIYPMPDWQDSIPSQLGLSWFIGTFAGHPMYSHTGSQGGFTADYVSIPEEDFFYTILSNTPVDINETRAYVLHLALERGWLNPKTE